MRPRWYALKQAMGDEKPGKPNLPGPGEQTSTERQPKCDEKLGMIKINDDRNSKLSSKSSMNKSKHSMHLIFKSREKSLNYHKWWLKLYKQI